MSDLNTIIEVQISRNTSTPTQAGFGTPLLLTSDPELNPKAGTEWGSTRVRTYSSITDVATDFATTTNTYLMATALFAQNPRPSTIKVGRRETFTAAQVVDFTPTTFVVGVTIGCTINGTAYPTVLASSSDIATAIDEWVAEHTAALATAGVTVADGATKITLTADTNGDIYRYATPVNGTLLDATAADELTEVVTDLTALIVEDDDWYCLLVDSYSKQTIHGAADAIEAMSKLFIARTFDTEVRTLSEASETASPTSIAGILKDSNNDRTAIFFTESGDFVDCAWAGNVLPEQAGSVTWAYRSLSGVGTDSGLDTSSLTKLFAKNVNVNKTLAGINVTRYGTAAGAEYLDVMRGTDWLAARIQERIYALLVNNDKVPYTDSGIQAVRGEILAQLQAGVSRDFLAADPEPTCTVPLAADVSGADKGNRILNNVTFRATLAGAIHKTVISGELDL